MVVVPEPSVKGLAAFVARAVGGAVGPACEQRADEAFCFAVRLRPARARAQVADAERLAGERMDGCAVGGAVGGEQTLHPDAVASKESDCSAQEADGRGRFLVGEHFSVGEAAVVVDGDVDELPTDRGASVPLEVGEGRLVVVSATADALAGAALDAA